MFMGSLKIVLLLSMICTCVASRHFCGSDLADVMALVCKGRGYNMAFSTEMTPAEGRYKRGIVDECCKRGCTWSTLESYCSADKSELQIRKRSDFSNKWQPETTEDELENNDKFKYDTNEMKVTKGIENNQKLRFNIVVEESKPLHPNHNSFSYWKGLNRQIQNPRGPSVVNKVKRNDIDEKTVHNPQNNNVGLEDSVSWQDFLLEGMKPRNNKSEEKKQENSTTTVPIRHHHKKSDMVRKVNQGKSINSSQIGTVPPYFHGRTLVLPPSRKL